MVKVLPMVPTEGNTKQTTGDSDVEPIYCKDCEYWIDSHHSIRVEGSELRYCLLLEKLRFGYDHQCQMVVETQSKK